MFAAQIAVTHFPCGHKAWRPFVDCHQNKGSYSLKGWSRHNSNDCKIASCASFHGIRSCAPMVWTCWWRGISMSSVLPRLFVDQLIWVLLSYSHMMSYGTYVIHTSKATPVSAWSTVGTLVLSKAGALAGDLWLLKRSGVVILFFLLLFSFVVILVVVIVVVVVVVVVAVVVVVVAAWSFRCFALILMLNFWRKS